MLALAIGQVLGAAARVFIGVHHPIDVLIGFAIGAGCGLGFWYALARLRMHIDGLDVMLERRHLHQIRLGVSRRQRHSA